MNKCAFLFSTPLTASLLLFGFGCGPAGQENTTPGAEVEHNATLQVEQIEEQKATLPLVSGDLSITYIELDNTHSRTIEDGDFQMSIKEENEGVFWEILCVGVQMSEPFDKILLNNEKGQSFTPIPSYIQTTGHSKSTTGDGTVLYEGPSTRFFLVGPDDSERVTVMFGDASVEIEVGG